MLTTGRGTQAECTFAGEGSKLSARGRPGIDLGPQAAARDPALLYHEGTMHCFYTMVQRVRGRYQLAVGHASSRDLTAWDCGTAIEYSALSFSSPGNILRAGDEWVMCLQSYPVAPGEVWSGEDARLWLSRSRNLFEWTAPVAMDVSGCVAQWTSSRRQIDPYLVCHDGEYYCFYKSDGCLGVMVSSDLRCWRNPLPQRPVLCPELTAGGHTLENPCVVAWREGLFRMFYSPCCDGRGIGSAVSTDLLNWEDEGALQFPELAWAPGGVSAAMVLDMRDHLGGWLMAYHGERDGPMGSHAAAIGFCMLQDETGVTSAWRT